MIPMRIHWLTLGASLLCALVLASCGGGSHAIVPSTTTSNPERRRPTPMPSSTPITETPLALSSFDQSVGINTHMMYITTPYVDDYSVWSPLLFASRIKHVRDQICPQVETSWCINVYAGRIRELASHGIHTDFLTTPKDSASWVDSYVSTLGVADGTEAFEGWNECDVSRQCGSWQTTEAAWQRHLYTLKSPGVTIIGPSMATSLGYSLLGNLSTSMDVGNIHDYPQNNYPEAAGVTPARLSWVRATSGNDPVWSTEDNYSTDPTYANYGVPEVVQERYLSRILMEHLRLGVMRTYIYQLFDYGPDAGQYMGLLHADYTAKPAWTRLDQLMGYLDDAGTSPRTPLRYSLSGDASGALHHLLFQRSDGTYTLALWIAKSVYSSSSHTILAPTSETVTVSLPTTFGSATIRHFNDYGQIADEQLTGAAGVFRVPVSSLISVMTAR